MRELFKAWKKSTNFEMDNGSVLCHKTKNKVLNIWLFESFEIDTFDQKFNVDF